MVGQKKNIINSFAQLWKTSIQQGVGQKLRDVLQEREGTSLKVFFNYIEQYQPSGAGGTRSPPVTPHCLQRRTACQWTPKWRTGSGKVSTPRFWVAPVNIR